MSTEQKQNPAVPRALTRLAWPHTNSAAAGVAEPHQIIPRHTILKEKWHSHQGLGGDTKGLGGTQVTPLPVAPPFPQERIAKRHLGLFAVI